MKLIYSYMKKIYLFISILVLILSIISCGKKKEQPVVEKKIQAVKIMEIKEEPFEEVYNAIGVVKAYNYGKLSAEEGGIITYIKEKGSRVRRGEVVVRLLKETDIAMYEQAVAQYNLAKDNYERIQKLYLEGAATEQQFTTAGLQLDVAEKSVNVYLKRLSKGFIRSPITGVVDAKIMNKGEMAVPGTPVISIVDISRVKINAGIPERFIENIKIGKTVKITFEDFPGEEFSGKISYVSPTINPQSRTIEVEVVINNPSGKLKPEMSAKLEITKSFINNAIVLRQDYIIDNIEEKYVFVLENNIAKKRILKLGDRTDNRVVIIDGLLPGDKLIYEGFQYLNDGDEVQVIN